MTPKEYESASQHEPHPVSAEDISLFPLQQTFPLQQRTGVISSCTLKEMFDEKIETFMDVSGAHG